MQVIEAKIFLENILRNSLVVFKQEKDIFYISKNLLIILVCQLKLKIIHLLYILWLSYNKVKI